MPQGLIFEGVPYIPAALVGRHFGYTKDYILILTREGKIDGRKIGHRWYVNLESAEIFFQSARVARTARLATVSKTIKAELRSHQQRREGSPLHVAVFGACAVFVFVLSIGWFVRGDQLGNQVVQTASVSAAAGQRSTSLSSENSTRVVAPSLTVQEATYTTHTSLIVAPDQVLTTTTIESIRESFSDDVSVSIDPEHPDTGIIIPHFKDADGEAYRYLMVPVSEGNGVQN